ncbi:ABC transporter permease subunit [Clostridiales bacterium COT073_COT-073]|nr:ABC transporter permease subunit [Clostridiales bacterium COT073_COT-073]
MKFGKRKLWKGILLEFAFIILCLLTLLPIIYALSVSLNASNSLFTSGLRLFPDKLTLENYYTILLEKPFLIWMRNSIVLSLLTVFLTLFVTVPAAYAFSRFRFRGQKATMSFLLLLNAFPTILSLFAIYRIIKILGLLNKKAALVLIYTGTMAIFTFWTMKGYFDSIPNDMEEAAKIDGATNLQLISKIILPLALPSVLVAGVLVFINAWNEYIFATIFITGTEKYTLALGLYSLQATDYTRNWPLFSAASILTSLPTLIVFFLVQRHMVAGLTAGGVKG